MSFERPDYSPSHLLALRLDFPVHEGVGDFPLRTPDRFSRSKEARNLLRHFARSQEWTVREHSKPYFNHQDLPHPSEAPITPVWFIETAERPWMVIAGWPFPGEAALRASQLLNTVTLDFSVRHAYANNWVLSIAVGGYPAGTILKPEYAKFCGIPEDAFRFFQPSGRMLSALFDLPPEEIERHFKTALVDSEDDDGVDTVQVGTLMRDLGVWDANWRRHFIGNSTARESEIYLVEQ